MMMSKFLERIQQNTLSFNNNTILIRLLLSLTVFYSHFFAVYGLKEPSIPSGIHSLGWYAVNMFFFISGILVAQSFKNRDVLTYISARILRIMPAYLCSLVITKRTGTL